MAGRSRHHGNTQDTVKLHRRTGLENFAYVSNADLTAADDGGFKGQADDGSAEIGYSVIPLFRGKGLATEAARALLAQAFSDNRLKFVKAETSTGNPKSATVLRKIGMSDSGERHSDEDRDLICWSISRESYERIYSVPKTSK